MSTIPIAGALASLADRLWPRRPHAPACDRRPVLLIVEGQYDVEFLRRIGRTSVDHSREITRKKTIIITTRNKIP